MPNEYYREASPIEEDMWHNGYAGDESRYVETDAGLFIRI